MTESELKDYKAKWALKEADLREINKELMQSRKEVLGYSDKLRIMEREHAEELAKVERDHETKIQELSDQKAVSAAHEP